MKTVLIAARDPIVRIGIAAVLRSAQDWQPVAEAETAAEVREAVTRWRPDVVVLDVGIRRSDPALLPDLAARSPASRVLVLVDHAAEDCPLRGLAARGRTRLSDEALDALDECCLVSLRGGARGCLPKASDPERLLAAVRTVAAGEIAAAPWLAVVLPRSGRRRGPLPAGEPGPLTARELEVIRLIAQGLTNKRVAVRLGIGLQTVKNHTELIMRKLGVENRLGIGLFAVKYHLTSANGEA